MNASGSPSASGVETISTLGSPTGLMPEPSSARSYHSGSESRIASSSTAPKPSRWITSDGGALPLRKPGSRISRASARAARLTPLLDVLGGNLDLDPYARVGQLCDARLHAR